MKSSFHYILLLLSWDGNETDVSLTIRRRRLDPRTGIVPGCLRVLHIEYRDATVSGTREPPSRRQAEDAGAHDENLGVWMKVYGLLHGGESFKYHPNT